MESTDKSLRSLGSSQQRDCRNQKRVLLWCFLWALSLGASSLTVFRRIILPNLVPALLSGAALAFARAVGEFGSVVLISGNIPFETQVSSVYAFKLIESDAPISAAAVSTVLLAISLVVLIGIRGLGRWGARHDR